MIAEYWHRAGVKALALSLMVALLLTLAACSSPAATTPEPTQPASPEPTEPPDDGGETPVATPTTADSPTPAMSDGEDFSDRTVIMATSDWGNELFADYQVRGEGGVYQRLVHDFLIFGDQGRALVPGVAEDWSFSEDGLTWTFQIRDGITFHNGTELTAEDVAFALEIHHDEEAETNAVSPTNQNMSRVTEPFMVTGDGQVSVTTTEPQTFLAFYLSEMFADPAGVVFDKEYREEVGREGYNQDPSPGGSGPFTLVSHQRGSNMVFERFDDYWNIDERNHRFGTLELHVIPELSTRMAALRTGEMDLGPANLEVRNQVESAGGQIIFGPESQYVWFVAEGCWVPEAVTPCDQKEFRQALDYAIDKELIASQIWGDEMASTRGWAHVTPSSLGYEPDLDSWPFDPEMARELLAQIDCADASCFPDPYVLYTWEAGEVPFLPDVAQLICRMWEDNLGVNDCEVEVGDSVSIQDRLHSFAIAGNYAVRPNEGRFDGGSIMFSGYASPNPTRGTDPELKEAVQRAISLIGTTEERHDAYHDMYLLAREQHWEWSIATISLPWAVSGKIADWQPWPMLPYASALWTVELSE